VDDNKNNYLEFSEFMYLLRLLRQRPKIEELFKKYASDDIMSAEQLLQFYHKEQGETSVTLDDIKRIVQRFSKEVSLH